MTTAEENRLMTQCAPGTPGGKLLRNYWHPIATLAELPENGPPVPITVMGEDLVLFRDEAGRPGLLQRACPHRCADLSYGRIEDGGLRCLYHGWLFDVNGKCLETPAEPDSSKLKDHVEMAAYPCLEAAGLIFAYMGEGEAPPMPDYEFLKYTGPNLNVRKTIVECNWLQALEGDIDPSHLSYLHRPVKRVDPRSVPGSERSADQYYRDDRRPTLECEKTHYGLRIYSIRNSGEDRKYVRITNFLMPNKAAIVGNEGRLSEGYSVNWHVPIDDHEHMRFDITFNRVRPIDLDLYDKRTIGEVTDDNRLVRNKRNRYLQNREEMQTTNFTGMGGYFIVHDAFVTESMGEVTDRTRETLGTTDVIIAQARRLILEGVKAVQAGKAPVHAGDTDMDDLIVYSHVVPKSLNHKDIPKEVKAGELPRMADE